MKIKVKKEVLQGALSSICGVVERRQTLPVLSNLLLVAKENKLTLTGTDLEVELICVLDEDIEIIESGETTLPARKLLDICKNLNDGDQIQIVINRDKGTVTSGKSRFLLSTLPTEDFPCIRDIGNSTKIDMVKKDLKRLIEKTSFAMALQDVRYYLNGLLFEISKGRLRTVATDGHRLALSDVYVDVGLDSELQILIPRKGVLELQRILEDSDDTLSLELGTNHIRIQINNVTFTSKLIDGKFPDYDRAIPSIGEKVVTVEKDIFKKALTRAAILSNEKYKGVRLDLADNQLVIQAHNPEQEEAVEKILVNYANDSVEVGFNVNYLLDATNAVTTDEVSLGFADSNNSCLVSATDSNESKYVVMPMRL